MAQDGCACCVGGEGDDHAVAGVSLRYGGAIDGRIAALADSGQRTLVRVRLRSLYQVLCEHAQRVCLYRFQTIQSAVLAGRRSSIYVDLRTSSLMRVR